MIYDRFFYSSAFTKISAIYDEDFHMPLLEIVSLVTTDSRTTYKRKVTSREKTYFMFSVKHSEGVAASIFMRHVKLYHNLNVHNE